MEDRLHTVTLGRGRRSPKGAIAAPFTQTTCGAQDAGRQGQGMLPSGRSRRGGRQRVSAPPAAGGAAGPPAGIFHTQARRTYEGAAPSAAVRKPDA